MSEALREVLRDRSEVPPFAFDADALISQATSRKRRSRLVNAIGVVALTAAGVTGVVLIDGPERVPEPAAPPARFVEPKLTYALGTVVHYGGQSFDTGVEVNRGLARTDYGFALVEATDVWFSDGTESKKIGRVFSEQVMKIVTSDAEGRLVAWAGPAENGHGEVVVYDTRLGEVVAKLDNGMMTADGYSPGVIAIDGGAVYWKRRYYSSEDPLLRYDVSTGEQAEVELPGGSVAVDVAAGAVMYWMAEPSGGHLIVESLGSRSRIEADASLADLSPDASFVFAPRESGAVVVDTETADEITFHPPKIRGGQFMGWVDAHTFALWDGNAVLTCEAPSGTCEVAQRDPGYTGALWRPRFPGGYVPG